MDGKYHFLISIHSTDDQFRKLENKECGEYYQTHRNLGIAMLLCRQAKRCMGVEVFRCDEKLSTIRLCEYGFGYKDSFRIGSCVYDKEGNFYTLLDNPLF